MKLAFCRLDFTAMQQEIAMIMVAAIYRDVEDLLEPVRLPSVEALRPSSCPSCGQLAFSPGERLGIVGHGTYSRQVVGIAATTREVIARIRRYLCRGCKSTISILPDQLHPRRWYAAAVILEALRLYLIEGLSDAEVRRCFGIDVDSENWRSLRRWRSQLLVTLWYWFARRLGFKKAARTREEGRRRLLRLLAQSVPASADTAAISRDLLTSTVHFQGLSWPLGHDPPEKLTKKSPPR
jgi:hypothetical protein